MNRSENLDLLAVALAKFHTEVSNPTKNAQNPHYKSKYADLAEIISVSREPLALNGLSVVQMVGFEGNHVVIETVLLHSSGQFLSSMLSVPVSKMDAQGIGSATTYGRRYSWAAMCGLAQEDDDANAAVGGKSQPQSKPAPATTKEDALILIQSQTSVDDLTALWGRLPLVKQDLIAEFKTKKAELTAVVEESSNENTQ